MLAQSQASGQKINRSTMGQSMDFGRDSVARNSTIKLVSPKNEEEDGRIIEDQPQEKMLY